MNVKSPIDMLALRIARRPLKRQLQYVEAVICLMVASFMTVLAIGIGIEVHS